MTYVPPRLPSTRAPEARPIVRGQNEDPSPIRIPSPNELGLGSKSTDQAGAAVDWITVERRLERAGATGYHLQKMSEGYRFSAEVRGRVVLGQGSSPAVAIENLLGQLAN